MTPPPDPSRRPAPQGAPRPGPSHAVPRKRMMAQGRKGHFMHDARQAIVGEGGLDEQHARAFLESVFQRGTRQSTQEALLFVQSKVADGTVTAERGRMLASLVDRYSFWR